MKKSYDLTTLEGVKTAVSDTRDIPIIGNMLQQQLLVLEKGIGLIEKTIAAVSPAQAVNKQAQAAAELIKAGKENGVEEMDIVMEENAGINFESPVEGANVSFTVGSKGKTTMKVKYS